MNRDWQPAVRPAAFRTSARIEEINIANDPDLDARYSPEIPVLLVNGRKGGKWGVSEVELTGILGSKAGEAGGAG